MKVPLVFVFAKCFQLTECRGIFLYMEYCNVHTYIIFNKGNVWNTSHRLALVEFTFIIVATCKVAHDNWWQRWDQTERVYFRRGDAVNCHTVTSIHFSWLYLRFYWNLSFSTLPTTPYFHSSTVGGFRYVSRSNSPLVTCDEDDSPIRQMSELTFFRLI